MWDDIVELVTELAIELAAGLGEEFAGNRKEKKKKKQKNQEEKTHGAQESDY